MKKSKERMAIEKELAPIKQRLSEIDAEYASLMAERNELLSRLGIFLRIIGEEPKEQATTETSTKRRGRKPKVVMLQKQDDPPATEPVPDPPGTAKPASWKCNGCGKTFDAPFISKAGVQRCPNPQCQDIDIEQIK